MRILLTNDDGVNASGVKVLERIARAFSDDIWIVAPTEEQSGAGHSLTLTRPVRLRKLGDRRYCVTGTPTDAVMMAVAHLMKETPPDLVLSGVNRGANLGEDVTYSGTVSAAMEGAMAGFPAVALSQAYAREGMGDTVPFAAAQAWAERVLRPIVEGGMPPRTLVNVNFPALAPGLAAAFAAVALWGLHMGLSQGLLSRMVADRSPAPLRGSAFGLFNLAAGIAMLAASVTAGLLWDRIGPSATFLAGAAFAVAAALALVIRKRR